MSAELVDTAASALGPLTDEVVFLGGASIHLWITDAGVPPTRSTEDVDVISEVSSLASLLISRAEIGTVQRLTLGRQIDRHTSCRRCINPRHGTLRSATDLLRFVPVLERDAV